MTRPHIVFVDDEPRVLAGLRRMLWNWRNRWDMSFALGGREALRVLEQRRCEVIVSDFRMPDLDGGELLCQVRQRYPGTGRLILSGYARENHLLRVSVLAHGYINKPCPREEIIDAIELLIRVRGMVMSDGVRRLAAGTESLPHPPSTLRNLLAALESEDASMDSVVRAVEPDAECVAELLRMANLLASPAGEIRDLTEAAALLGMPAIRSVVLMQDMIRDCRREPAVPSAWVDRLYQHSVLTASLARQLAGDAPWADAAYVAALVHEVGQLVAASVRPAEFASCLARWEAGAGPLAEIEADAIGCGHPEIGGYFGGRWGMRAASQEAVLGHTAPWPWLNGAAADDLVSVTAVAHALIEAEYGAVCGAVRGPATDESRLHPDLADRLARWRGGMR